jgi:hypothetical protein
MSVTFNLMIRKAAGIIFLLAFLSVLGSIAADRSSAEEQVPQAPAIPTAQEARDALNAYQPDADLAAPETSGKVEFDAATSAAEQAAWQEYFAYRTQGYKHRQSVFEWQWLSSKIIFVTVLVLVFLGMYFAAVQFHVGLGRGKKSSSAAKTGSNADNEATELELSWKAIKVRSDVLGVIILALSLAFFYLYLAFVYPIQNTF